jgi:hypothetical protein
VHRNSSLDICKDFVYIKDQVSAFQTYITLIEKDKISATEVAMNIDSLVNNLESRKSNFS